MKRQKTWNIQDTTKFTNKSLDINFLTEIILKNRSISSKKEIIEFLDPNLQDITVKSVGIDKKQLQKTATRIFKAIRNKEKIVVYGDYDVDGITGTAILWETLFSLKAQVMPYIPHRIDEGYGLSIRGLENILAEQPDIKLIITVDNGIVANDAVNFANKKNIDVIITDHHAVGKDLPDAYSIIHTTKLCGAGVGWMLSQELKEKKDSQHLDLVTLATVADLVPLTGANRVLLKRGLPFLHKTKRVGLQALFSEAAIEPQNIGVYEIGHIIAPRLNAMGRLESAMDSLRLLCTKDPVRAKKLASQLGVTNRERQLLTQARSMHAIEIVRKQTSLKNVVVISENYEEGIIGLVAGKLVEEYYRPSIVISQGEKISKASARSVSGFNIIDFIRSASHLLINAGGHPMAAGFTIETANIPAFKTFLEENAEKLVTKDHLVQSLRVDCELSLNVISQKLYDSLQNLEPFGMGNPEPTFVSFGVTVADMRLLGKDKNHLKLAVGQDESPVIEAIAFGMGEKAKEIKVGDKVDIVYVIDENQWNGNKKLQLKIKDIKIKTK